jgi:adenylate kinase family enzyme
MIIHISGAPGSGKTTIGLKLKKHYKIKVIVKDLDDLFGEFMKLNTKKFSSKKYQKFIDDFINKHNNKSIIFVGLNSEHITNKFYKINPDYKFYIDLPVDINLKRHFLREIEGWINWMQNRDKNILFNQLMNNENEVINDLTNSFTGILKISEQKKFIMSFDAHYIKENYQFLSSTKIYNKIIQSILKL